MFMIKLIASDMDGTLLGNDHKISEENLKAIKMAEEKGINFAIVTGRKYEDVEPFLRETGLKCQCVVMNGAEYRDYDGSIIEKVYIDKIKAREVIEKVNKKGVALQIYTNKGMWTTETKEQALEDTAHMLEIFMNIPFEEALKIAVDHPEYTELNYIEDLDEFFNSDVEIAKFVAFYDSEETTNKVKKELSDIEGIAVSGSFKRNIEINNIEAQKGLILSKVAKKLGMKKEEVVVLGDSFNDYSMFKEFPISFAMGNAIDEIKEIAKYITDTNYNDGVAKAIYKIIN